MRDSSGQLYVAHIAAHKRCVCVAIAAFCDAAPQQRLGGRAAPALRDAGVRDARAADGRRRRATRRRREPPHARRHAASSATLARTCAWARRYDVIVFHDGSGDALRPRLAALRNQTRLRLQARDVSDVFAAPAPAIADGPRRQGLRTFGLGYRRMCRFWFSGVFELEEVRRRTYLLRLDTDSELGCRMDSRDPFEVMARRRAVYVYVAVKTDHPRVVRNLTAFGAAYARRVPPVRDAFYRFPPDARHVPAGCPAPMFYTNFEVMNVSWFVQLRTAALARAVDASGSGAARGHWNRPHAVDAMPPAQDGADLREPLGRRAAPVDDAGALREQDGVSLFRRRVQLRAPRAPESLRLVLEPDGRRLPDPRESSRCASSRRRRGPRRGLARGLPHASDDPGSWGWQ